MKVGVVTRKLKLGDEEFDTVVSAVFTDPGDRDALENYFESKMNDHKESLIKLAPEFEYASWTLTILKAD